MVNHSCHVCLPHCHVRATVVASSNVRVSCGERVVHTDVGGLGGDGVGGNWFVRAAGNRALRVMWASTLTPTQHAMPTWH